MLAAGFRVIRADLRSRPLYTALTGLVVAFALGALVVTLHGRATLDDPYDRLFSATDGAHVTAISPSREDLARIATLPGVAASDGPRPLVRVPVRFGGEGDALGLIGLARTQARVERPLILDGRAGRAPGEVVLQREFARGHGIAVGDTLTAGVGTTRRRAARGRHRLVRGIGRRRLGRPGRRARAGHEGVSAAVRRRRAPGRPGGGKGVRPARRELGARGRRAHARLAHAADRADRRRAAAAHDPPDDDRCSPCWPRPSRSPPRSAAACSPSGARSACCGRSG